MELNSYNLKENPFRIGPAVFAKDIIWAGFPELKKNIEKRIEFSIRTTPSRIVLNWGRYGSGKTHAANYYTRTSEVSAMCKTVGASDTKSIKLTLPRTSKDPVQAFFRSFLGQISTQNIKDDLSRVKADFENFDELLNSLSTDNTISKVLHLIESEELDKLDQIESYLFGDSTKTTLTKLGIPFGISDDEQIVNFISTYVNLITYNKKINSSFILWIDEFEDIDTLNKSNQDRFTTFLRQLFDKTPNNLLIFLNFTPKTFYNIEDLSLTLGEALATRAKISIQFDITKTHEAINYIKEIISHPTYRIKSVDNDFHPFNPESIEYILDNIGTLSVRKINEVLSLLIELGLMLEKEIIDKQFIKENKLEIISWEGE